MFERIDWDEVPSCHHRGETDDMDKSSGERPVTVPTPGDPESLPVVGLTVPEVPVDLTMPRTTSVLSPGQTTPSLLSTPEPVPVVQSSPQSAAMRSSTVLWNSHASNTIHNLLLEVL